MSKSKGNVVDPHSIIAKYGVDPLRYFLLRDGSLHHDGGQPRTFLSLPQPHSSLSLSLKITPRSVWLPRRTRTSLTPWGTYSRGSVPQGSTPGDLDSVFTPTSSPLSTTLPVSQNAGQATKILHWSAVCRTCQVKISLLIIMVLKGGSVVSCLMRSFKLTDVVRERYDSFDFNGGIAAVMKTCHQVNSSTFISQISRIQFSPSSTVQANIFIDRHAPWELVRVPDQLSWLQTVLSVAVETVRLGSILLYPVIPTSAREILQRIGFEQDLNLKSDASLGCLLTSAEGVKRFNETNHLSFGSSPVFTRLK